MSEKYYFIKSQLNGYVLDVKDNSTKPATQVIVFPQKESGADNQLWGITSEGLIKSKLNGYVLDIEGGSRAAGARVIVYPKNEPSGTPNQQWTIENGLIISKLNGYVLDIEGGSQAPGASVIVYPKNGEQGTANQLWDLVAEIPAAPEVVSSNTVKPSASDEQSESTEADTTANSANEVIEVEGNKLIKTLKGIIGRDNVSRVIVYWANGDKLLDIPYAAGLTVTALVTLFLAPVTALTPFVLLLGRFKIEIVRPEGNVASLVEEATSTAEAEAEATSQETVATSTETEVEAETEVETETEVEAEVEAETETETETEAEAEVESEPAAPAQEPEPSKGPVDLWQIGKPGTRGKEFSASGGWKKVFDYTVETDADPIGSPNAPRIITVPGLKSKPKKPSTDQLNIHFTLERDYAESDCTLFYDWYGSETDTLTLDGQLLKEIQGKGEGKLQQSVLPLPALSSGQHTLSITTKGGRGGQHWIDYLKLVSSDNEPKQAKNNSVTNGENVNQDNVKQNKIEPDIFSTGSKIALQADTGKWFARCNGCQQTVGDNPDTITVHVEQPTSAPYAQFEVVNMGDGKIALKADTGKYVARCRGCIVRGAKPDSVTVHVTDPSAAYAQFTPELLENGKYALKADTGQYVARCNGCSPTATTPDTVTIHVDDPQGAPYAQWNIISISS